MPVDSPFQFANVIMPSYSYKQDLKIHLEDESPPDTLYMSLGYDPSYDSQQKHYRRYYITELEKTSEVMSKLPFTNHPITRGQTRGLTESVFSSNEYEQVSTLKEVGEFKAIISVEQLNKKRRIDESKVSELIEKLEELHQKTFGEQMNFDFSKLSTHEGRKQFKAILKHMNCEDTDVHQYIVEMENTYYLNR